MAVMAMEGPGPITTFEQWYKEYRIDRHGCLEWDNIGPVGNDLWNDFQIYRREMDIRVAGYDVLEKLADGQVISPKPDLPNVSSGDVAGLVRRVARNVVQNCPNVEVISKFDDDDPNGVFALHILKSKVIGSDLYSNDMQQNLFASCKTSFALGFAAVVPVLQRDQANGYHMKYDTIHYRDVFPDPGIKDIRESPRVFVRRYLTRQEVRQLILEQAPGWDALALKALLKQSESSKQVESVDHQTKKHHQIPRGYEIITCYTNSGDPFLTFHAQTKMLLRIEKNKHPLAQHPVHFLVLEKDEHQPLGRSQIEQLVGRQDFQDLMLNGAMKLWYRNINPSIIGYGAANAVPNLSPGKYTQISNPNAKIEAFEVNTQTLMSYPTIAQNNLGAMVNQVGSADQQMASQAGNGMSQTPQGVAAQVDMVDITTNNYQKAIESFFSHYCSYALTIFFAELAAVKAVTPTAEARQKLLEAGFPEEQISDDGKIDMDFATLATEYWVRCVPGSLTELEDEKQLRTLNQLFVPLSQAMPALAAAQDTEGLANASKAMQFIIAKQIELSGSESAKEIGLIYRHGDVQTVDDREQGIDGVEERIAGIHAAVEIEAETNNAAIRQLQEMVSMLVQNQQQLLEKLGLMNESSDTVPDSSEGTMQPDEENLEAA